MLNVALGKHRERARLRHSLLDSGLVSLTETGGGGGHENRDDRQDNNEIGHRPELRVAPVGDDQTLGDQKGWCRQEPPALSLCEQKEAGCHEKDRAKEPEQARWFRYALAELSEFGQPKRFHETEQVYESVEND